MAIRDVNGLAVLVNILRTDHINCQVKKEGVPLTGFKVGLLPKRFLFKRGGGWGWGLHDMRYRQGQVKTLPFRHSIRTFQGVRNNPPPPPNADQLRLVSQRFLRVEKVYNIVKL